MAADVSPTGPLIGIVAGEPSGDLLGGALVAALRARIPSARFVGIGGPRMTAAGVHSLFPLEKLSVRGYVEVLRHFREIVGIRRDLKKYFLDKRPSVFIGIDAPDFNLDLETTLKAAGIPTVHYVSPSIWAWRGARIHKIRRAVSRMLTVFPFEAEIYERAGVPVSYVGHPLADMLAKVPARTEARAELKISSGAPVVALLPGSRVSELESLADLFVAAAEKIAAEVDGVRLLVPLVNRQTRELFEAALYRRENGELNITLLFGHAHEAMAAADVVLVASGTATLEAALLQRAMVITYRMPRVSWWIMNSRRYQPWVGLPNILAGEFVVPELLQDAATPEALSAAVIDLLRHADKRKAIEQRFAQMTADLRLDAAERAAEAILPCIRDVVH
ncbi:MAG: lipid-A-disaccharide synthase [Betaproteobacteria bacterium]|nr:lipid-A-disaccharide synthase [Betaproteobacteria bacterium]